MNHVAIQDAAAPPARRDRVLVVEDGLLNRHLARALLERADYQVDTVEDGAQALAAVSGAERAYDVLLMDLDMPVMDGFEAAEAIRELGRGRGTMPILAFSAIATPGQVSRALACGMDGHIAKPFDPATFAAAVRACLDQADEARLRRQQAGDVASSPVWNRRTFEDLCGCLGEARLRRIVGLFAERLDQARTILGTDDPSARAVAFEAHGLASATGLLGFEELCATSHRVQNLLRPLGEDAAPALPLTLAAGLLAAIGRAQEVLRDASAIRFGGAWCEMPYEISPFRSI